MQVLPTSVRTPASSSLGNQASIGAPEVRFKDYGLESFEVIDNGSGIRPDDYHSIGVSFVRPLSPHGTHCTFA